MGDFTQDIAGFLSSVQRLLELPGKVEELERILVDIGQKVNGERQVVLPQVAPLSPESEICENCIRLTKAVSTETVEHVFGMMRELLIEVRDSMRAGVDRVMSLQMLEKVIEIASVPLSPMKGRSGALARRGKNPGSGQLREKPRTYVKRTYVNWLALAKERGYPTVKEMLVDMRTRMGPKDIAAELGSSAPAVYKKLSSLGIKKG